MRLLLQRRLGWWPWVLDERRSGIYTQVPIESDLERFMLVRRGVL